MREKSRVPCTVHGLSAVYLYPHKVTWDSLFITICVRVRVRVLPMRTGSLPISIPNLLYLISICHCRKNSIWNQMYYSMHSPLSGGHDCFIFLSAAIRPQKRPAPRKRSCENNISVCCVYSVAVHWPESDGTIYLLMMFDEHSLISNCVCTIVWYTAVRTYRRYLVYARALFVRLDSRREWGVLLCCSAHKSPLSHIADRH